MTWARIFFNVSLGAIIGMVMGGLFGFGAGSIAPKFFVSLVPWANVEPVGTATVYGGVVGVILGGGLATFGIIVQAILEHKKMSSKETGNEKENVK